jgi:hypothetical protein
MALPGFRWPRRCRRLLVSTFSDASLTEQVSDAYGTNPAASDHSVEGNNTATSTSLRCTSDRLAKGQLNKSGFGGFTTRPMKLRGIEVSDPNFDPFIWVIRLAHAQAIAIADISNHTRKFDARTIR